MVTAAHTAMNTDRLTLVQWLSPSFPIGAFSYSHGLETAAQQGMVCNAADLQDWIATVLKHGAGHADALFLAAAYHADGLTRLDNVDTTARAIAASRERLLETEAQGAAFCDAVHAVWELELPKLVYPVAIGFAARQRGLDLAETGELYLHAFLSNLTAVGMRLSLLGQTEGQRVISRLAPLCLEIARATRDGNLESLSSTTFLPDIASMQHETQNSRIFRT